MKEELVYLGVDIAKSHLDAAIGNEKRVTEGDLENLVRAIRPQSYRTG